MAAIVIGENAKAPCLVGNAGRRATAPGMARRATDCAAATVLACAVAAALLQLVVELVSFPAPVAVTAITVMAAVLLNSLRRPRGCSCRPSRAVTFRERSGRIVRSWESLSTPKGGR
jgi:hypothetical protein